MDILYLHIGFRTITVFLIFYLLEVIRKSNEINTKVNAYWYLLGVSQACFLFFPFLKNLPIPFIFIIPIKALLLGFPFLLWISSKIFLDESFHPRYYHFLLLFLIEIMGLSLSRVGGKIIFPNGSLVPDSIVPFLVGCTFSFQLFLTGLVFYNLFKAPKIDLNNSELFIKKFFLISASVSELMILITLLMYRQEDSEIRYWFVTLFNFAFLLTSFMLLKIHKTKNKEKIKHPLLSSNEIELIKISFANFLINNKQLLYEDCTLKNISEKINIPEYKLRKFINVELKFNNFQHFINFYRIEEACRLLKSQEYEKIPISRIALMVGYNSIATFNRVFKEVKNASPGEYRLN